MKQIYMRVHLYRLREACLQDAIKRVTQANKAPGFERVGKERLSYSALPLFCKDVVSTLSTRSNIFSNFVKYSID